MWAILAPVDECPVYEIMPMVGDVVQSGHTSGIFCVCLPCLDDSGRDGDNVLLIHHLLVNGTRARCTELNSHSCSTCPSATCGSAFTD